MPPSAPDPVSPSLAPYLVLAAVDTSAAAEGVVALAARQALARPGGRLHLLHVVDTLPLAAVTVGGSPFALPSAAALLRTARELLERLMNAASTLGIRPTGHLRVGAPRQQVLQSAIELGADLLVIGTHEQGALSRFLLGSVAGQLVRDAPCPVLVDRPKHPQLPDDVPAIEPPCPACLGVRQATAGESLWCDRHAAHHPSARLHEELSEPYGMGTMTFRF